ncbi:hypothetical protein BGZ80_001641 [Entomortierella chlamydospora]|uniref:Methyltransferase domain-containing protein n=1 Tax=Entomortierella chlamydospora TaxID=101097 RepID=A0A9P6T3D0_9FUNG|nr:hypothetical protein BGZ80_001641 [Entomortierella chlamydospora]
MGANISGDDFVASDNKEVFQSYRIPPKAYKKKNKDSSKSSSDSSVPVSPTSVEFGVVPISRNGDQRQQPHSDTLRQRYRAGSLSSSLNKSRKDRPISHPPSFLSHSSSTSSLNLSIVNAAVAAGSPTPSIYPYSGGIVSSPLPLMFNGSGVGAGPRTNSGYSIGSESFETVHSVGSGLGRATYVNGKVVEVGFHGGSASSSLNSGPLYLHNNYTVQDFISYQQQQQQQFLEQQQFEYQQMLLFQQQQQQLRQQYQHQQQLLLQQQQQLQHGTAIRPSHDPVLPQVTGVVLQTKTRRPARHPDHVSNGNGANSHNRNVSQSITIPSTSSSSLHRQPNTTSSGLKSPRSRAASNPQSQFYGSSPTVSNQSGAGSSFSSTASQYQNMLAMTSTSPPSSSSSSLSTPGGEGGQSTVVVSTSAATSPPRTNKLGLSLDEIAAKILPPRRLLGGREYYPDKTLPYLLPCDEQEGERLLLQHYVIRYAFGSNVIAPIDTTIAGKVLDCGCGPGTWVMEMATEYEDLDFYGFDVSPMYPSAIHPRNAHFSMGNILDPEIPFASDSFLLVHQRNMLLGLTQDAWPGVVQDLFRCVIPGGQGWLQLSEVDPIWSRPGPVSRSFLKMLNETAQNRNVDVLLPQRLDQVLVDVGCENVKMMMVEIPIGPWGGKIGILWRDVLKAEMEALKPVVLQAELEAAVARGQDIAVCGAEMTTSEEWDEMMTQVWAEMDQYHTFSRVYLAYGQKP